MEYTEYFNAASTGISAVTAAGANTGNVLDVSMREIVSAVYLCASHTAGNGVFTVDGSNDGTNWVTSIAMQDATATASGTWVTSKTLNANGTGAVFHPHFPFKLMRIVCTITTDGAYTATVEAKG